MTDPISPVDLSKKSEPTKTVIAGRKKGFVYLSFFCIVILLSIYILYFQTLPSSLFKSDTFVDIPEGSSLSMISNQLEKNHIIRSSFIFSIYISHLGKERGINSGMYLFPEPENVFQIAHRLADGEHGIKTMKITLPEGYTIKEMSEIFDKSLSNFDNANFLSLAEGKEGYLFPDTYFFLSTATSGEVLKTLETNFDKKTSTYLIDSRQSGRKWNDILTMASIIEGEAVTSEDRHIVSGILWKRIKNGMRLGVDAPFMYILGKGSLELTAQDLATSSPYNTYKVSGLPPTPINNPGLDAIEAALHPTTTPYFFYLSDKFGTIHYAKTFAEHKLNKEKYLR